LRCNGDDCDTIVFNEASGMTVFELGVWATGYSASGSGDEVIYSPE
jgi:hypothetical protein